MRTSRPRLRFVEGFGIEPRAAARAPGRVNLIGEHTDHCGGRAAPMAIDRTTTVVVGRDDNAEDVRIASDLFGEVVSVPVDGTGALDPSDAPFEAGIALAVIAGHGPTDPAGRGLAGLRVSIESDVPVGAGLSSSAACAVALSLALDALTGTSRDVWERIALCCRAEEVAVGVPCGILDPAASLLAEEDTALLLHCGAPHATPLPLPLEDAQWWVIDSGIPRTLADSDYAERVAECESARQRLGVESLSALSPDDLRSEAVEKLPDVERRRVRHVVTENWRVRLFGMWVPLRGDPVAAGKILCDGHASLRDDFEVSHPIIDRCIARAQECGVEAGIFGARMVGGGFGGSIVLLAEADPGAADHGAAVADPLLEVLRAEGLSPRLFPVAPSAGARVLSLDELDGPASAGGSSS